MTRPRSPRMGARLKRILTHLDLYDWIKGNPPGVGDRSMDLAVSKGWIVGRVEEGRKRPRAWMLLPAGLDALEAEETPRKRKRRE